MIFVALLGCVEPGGKQDVSAGCEAGAAAVAGAVGFGSVAEAVDAGGDVTVCPGTWPANLTLTRNVTIVGAGAEASVLDGEGRAPVVTVEGGEVGLEDVGITGGLGAILGDVSDETGGGGLLIRAGSVDLQRVQLISNEADRGGGVYIGGGAFEGREVGFRANRASIQGGGLAAVGAATANCHACMFVANEAVGVGGGVYAGSGALLTLDEGTEVRDHTVEGLGGGLFLYGGPHVLSDVIIAGNAVVSESGLELGYGGGGISMVEAEVIATNSVVTDNEAPLGGGVMLWPGGTLAGLRVEGNRAERGGGLHVGAHGGSLTDVAVDGNTATDGGGLYVETSKTLAVVRGSVTGNVAEAGGGLFLPGAGAVSFTATTFADNAPDDATTDGGSYASFGAKATITCTEAGCE